MDSRRRRGRDRRDRRDKPGARAPRAEVPQKPVIADRPAAMPMSDDEVARMRKHLSFMRRYRRVLRMKLNAKEAEMVEGTVAPTVRGVCKHLLSKLDRSAIQAALLRKPLSESAVLRAEFLAGAVSISSDVGVLLDYLETLGSVRTHEQTARAFGFAVDRIDFAGISAARLGRLLQIMREVHEPEDLVHVLFGLLSSESFCTAFDKHRGTLDAEIVAELLPLRATHRVLQGDRPLRSEKAAFERGLQRLLAGTAAAFQTHSLATREKLVTEALERDVTWAVDCSGVFGVIGRPAKSKSYRKLGYLRATRLIRLGRDEDAIEQLDGILSAQPAALEAAALRDRLTLLPRLGRLAVQKREAGPLCSAFDLRTLSTVFVRIAPCSTLESAAQLHLRACLPGIAPVLDHGVDGDLAWVVVPPSPSRLATLLDGGLELNLYQSSIMAADGVRILQALALAGVRLPDLEPERLQLDIGGVRPQLILGDLSGATEGQTEISVAVAWCKKVLSWPPFMGEGPRVDLPDRVVEALKSATSLPELISAF